MVRILELACNLHSKVNFCWMEKKTDGGEDYPGKVENSAELHISMNGTLKEGNRTREAEF